MAAHIAADGQGRERNKGSNGTENSGKRGAIPAHLAPILDGGGVSQFKRLDLMKRSDRLFSRVFDLADRATPSAAARIPAGPCVPMRSTDGAKASAAVLRGQLIMGITQRSNGAESAVCGQFLTAADPVGRADRAVG